VVSKKEEEDEEVIVFQPLSKDREAASVAAEIFLQPTLLPTNGYGNPSDSEVSQREAAASLPDFQGLSGTKQRPFGSPFETANYSMSAASLGGQYGSGQVDLAVPTPWMSSPMSGSTTTPSAAVPLSASQWSSLSRIVDAAAPAYSRTDAGDWVLGNRSRVTNGVEKTTSTAGVLGHPKQTAINSSLWSSQLEALATNNLLPNLQLGSLSLSIVGWEQREKQSYLQYRNHKHLRQLYSLELYHLRTLPELVLQQCAHLQVLVLFQQTELGALLLYPLK
jgi:hypothetical protein